MTNPTPVYKEGRKKPLILHIDDSHLVLMAMQVMLEGLNCESIQAFGGEDAIKMAAQRNPDLVITDMMMPVMDGCETVRRLRAQKETKMTPILMLTGDDSERAIGQAMSSGATDYLLKPVKEQRLKEKLALYIRPQS